ncbi:MAG TPA: nitroreductase/quinone reductase family protein [Solirubrobacteraceae bacterium]|jgi:hypothetical protein
MSTTLRHLAPATPRAAWARQAFAVFLGAHGLAHVAGSSDALVTASAGDSLGWLGGHWDVTDPALLRAFAVAWAVLAAAYVATAFVVWCGDRRWPRALAAVSSTSLVLVAVALWASVAGLVIDVVLLGIAVFAVNSNAGEVEGVAAYPSVRAIPGAVDGVVAVTPPEASAAVVADAAAAGVPRVWLHRGMGPGSLTDEAPRRIRRPAVARGGRRMTGRAGDRLLNHVVNPVVRALLRSPVHELMSDRVLLLTWTGRRTGRRHSAPLEYLADGERLTLVSRRSRVWWRNFTAPRPVEVVLAGRRRAGTAAVVTLAVEDRAAVLERLNRERGRTLAAGAAEARARDAVVVQVALAGGSRAPATP